MNERKIKQRGGEAPPIALGNFLNTETLGKTSTNSSDHHSTSSLVSPGLFLPRRKIRAGKDPKLVDYVGKTERRNRTGEGSEYLAPFMNERKIKQRGGEPPTIAFGNFLNTETLGKTSTNSSDQPSTTYYNPDDRVPASSSSSSRAWTTVPVPMSPRSNNREPQGVGDDLLMHPKGSRRKEHEEELNKPTQIPSPTHRSSMESLSGSGYIVSVALVLVVGAIVGVLATVSHHFHRRYQRRLPDAPGAPDAPSTTDNRYQPPPTRRRHHSATPMLSVSGGMEVGSGGRGGRGGIGGSLEGGPTTGTENDVVAATRDRAVRASSVRQDLALDLPPQLQLPDGEERPYGAHAGLHLRDPEQESEIYQKCVRPPPNRTVFDSESPPAYRSHSALLDAPDRIVRCHSAGSSLLKVFRKFPNSGSSTPSVIVPRRPTLSSYSESSSNLSNLSSLTVVPCETDETQNHV